MKLITNGKNDDYISLISGILFMIIGILFCCSTITIDFLNIVLGIALVILGLAGLGITFYKTKTMLNLLGAISTFALSFGITCFIVNIFAFVTYFIDVLMVVVGVLLAIDILFKVLNRDNKKDNLPIIIQAIVAAVLITFGAIFMAITNIIQFSIIVLGALLIVLGIYIIIMFFLKRKKTNA